MPTTDPVFDPNDKGHTAPRVVVQAGYRDQNTGALFVHKDLEQVHRAWTDEDHIAPPRADENFGDVESWTAYVKRFGADGQFAPFIAWNGSGLKAILDYHSSSTDPGRCQWLARYPFERSPEWKAWQQLANGHPVAQRTAVELLEDRAEDIQDPSPAALVPLLRTLRAAANHEALTEIRADGTTSVAFESKTALRAGGGGTIELPPEITIQIPVLKGHVGADGKPILYQLKVRLRASVDDQAHLALRFSIPNADKALELVYLDRVTAAKQLLGDGFSVLRAAG